jgi:hypothetical protein
LGKLISLLKKNENIEDISGILSIFSSLPKTNGKKKKDSDSLAMKTLSIYKVGTWKEIPTWLVPCTSIH